MGRPRINFTINFEEQNDGDAAFYALYAGLRMFRDFKQKQDESAPKGSFQISGAEAYCLLEDLKEQFPERYKQAEQEYDEVYQTEFICPICCIRRDPKSKDEIEF